MHDFHPDNIMVDNEKRRTVFLQNFIKHENNILEKKNIQQNVNQIIIMLMESS